MAAVAPAMHNSPLSTLPEAGIGSVSVSGAEIPANHSCLVDSSRPQAFPKPPQSPSRSIKVHRHPFINWHNYNINNHTSATFSNQDIASSPPSTMSPISQRSSSSSSPIESNDHSAYPTTSPHFNAFKPRSRSFAIPAPTSCCPNCGLRRPSVISDQTLSASRPLSSATRIYQRPHLPSHLHHTDCCPDTVAPYKEANMLGSSYHKRHHHRRRSSLCYAESLVNDAEVIDGGRIPPKIKQDWERQAENIAKKVCLRESRPNSPQSSEEAIIED